MQKPSVRSSVAGSIIITHACRVVQVLQGLTHLRVYCMILSTTLDPRKQLARTDLHTVYGSYPSSQELFWEQACFEI